MTRALIVGYGSIGRKHARVLSELGCDVAVVSRRPVEHRPLFRTISDALRAFSADYVVIASETFGHAAAVQELLAANYDGRLLIEKPLGEMPGDVFDAPFQLAAVGYNLRFHPVMVALANAVAGERLVTINAYCGQYLPDWRPEMDFRSSYSADPLRGGGVLRDLSHELDYLLWLGGPWRRVAGLGGHHSSLEISSDDCWALLFELDRCPVVSLQINYLDRPGRRQVVVNTAHHSYSADLIRGTLECDGREQTFVLKADHTYKEQHSAILAGDLTHLCTLAQGNRVMLLIDAIERAAGQGRWVSA